MNIEKVAAALLWRLDTSGAAADLGNERDAGGFQRGRIFVTAQAGTLSAAPRSNAEVRLHWRARPATSR